MSSLPHHPGSHSQPRLSYSSRAPTRTGCRDDIKQVSAERSMIVLAI